jgi:hypothetical protein
MVLVTAYKDINGRNNENKRSSKHSEYGEATESTNNSRYKQTTYIFN